MRLLALLCLLVTALPVQAHEAPRVLRVLTYNIHHGEGVDGKLDLERIASVIKAAQPDLVALQEVDQSTKRSNGVDQTARLGELTGMSAHFGKAMDYGGGAYGLAILARWPVTEVKTHALPAASGVEPRIVLEGNVELPDAAGNLRFLVTHVDHKADPKDRAAQVEKILELFPSTDGQAMILAGDFNATPESDVMRAVVESWTDTAAGADYLTYPSENPRIRIDYIFFRPAPRWNVIENRALEERTASDHRPVLSVLELSRASAGSPAR